MIEEDEMGILDAVKLKLILEQPFFGNLLMHIKFKEDDKVNGIGTDGINIFYNREKIENMPENQISFLVMHQVIHIILFHVFRGINYKNDELFHKASDLVANSIVISGLDFSDKYRLSELNVEHTINFEEAKKYTVEQVYSLLKKKDENKDDNNKSMDDSIETDIFGVTSFDTNSSGIFENGKSFGDDHSKWAEVKEQSVSERQKFQREMAQNIRNALNHASNVGGSVAGDLKRIIEETYSSKIDWRTALQNFVETEVTDYSFSPPDKRFIYNDLLMPDFNETEEKATGIFFFIDVSGSMDDEDIAECKAEVKSCLRQYDEKVEGYLGYFDYNVSNIQKFDDEESMVSIDALGGGGTSFTNIFKYLDEHESELDYEKKKVIILTDGYAEFPSLDEINVDEILWVINNDEVTPPYGEVVRI